ncbi:MAG TPA: DUF1653 domain-containing protein [Bacteriovoracaceae bacterium]|nr:DUF1653 domain-containing protein [Bacteriovoracaceae bacterium]
MTSNHPFDLILGGRYEHYKGNQYRLLNVAKHSESLELMVVYECLYDNPEGPIWVRPLSMFSESVEVNGKVVPRFKLIKNL